MPVHVDIHDRVGVLTLDRPRRAHAYDSVHLGLLDEGLRAIEASDAVALIVRSTGDGAFCGGADLHELKEARPEDALDLRSQRVFTRIARSRLVSIAAVQGAAVAGGCELSLACDLRVVGPKARFSLPETRLGLVPSAGGTTRLTRLVGPSVAKQVILAGRALSAQDSVRLGLALDIADDPHAEAHRLATEIALHHDPLALRLAKSIVDRGEDAGSLEAERVSEALLYSRRASTKAD